MNQHARLDMRPIPFIDVAAQRRRLGPRDRRRGRARDGALPVHSRARGARARSRSSRHSAARATRIGCCQRHRCAGAGADGVGDRAGRRGDLSRLSPFARPPKSVRSAARRRSFADVERRRPSIIDPGSLRARRGDGEDARAQAEGDHSGRSVRPAGRSRCDRRDRRRARTLLVLDDAAQAFGATYKGRKLGALATATATSFFPAKPLGCYGDGGADLHRRRRARRPACEACAFTGRAPTNTTTCASA